MNSNELINLIDIASGRKKAELVLKNGTVLNVFTNEWIKGDVAISGEYIAAVGEGYSGQREVDLTGNYVVPGFIDAHMHIESTMTTPRGFAGEVVPRGTTTMIIDPHEVANVFGIKGVEYMLDQSQGIPCDMYYMLPSCVPATSFEDSGAVLKASDLEKLIKHPKVLGLGEVMNYVGVCEADRDVIDKIELFQNKPIDGHAPSLTGKKLSAYCVAGVATDHECVTFEEAQEKIRKGMKILIRQGTAAKNLKAILSGAIKANMPFKNFAFCTDDKHIEDIRKKGHIRENIREAIKLGIAPEEAYIMASYNAARFYGLSKIGAVSEGYKADLAIISDRDKVYVEQVYKNGKQTSTDILPMRFEDRPTDDFFKKSINLKTVALKDFELKLKSDVCDIIEIVQSEIITKRIKEKVPTKDGLFVPNQTYQKIAVFERHKNTGKKAVAILKGFNVDGAVATTVSHDSHNIVVVGSCDSDMLCAIEAIKQQNGGYVLVKNGEVIGSQPLPIGGLMTDQPIDEVISNLSDMLKTAREMGIPENTDPFITLSFLCLTVIPEIRITNRYLWDSIDMKPIEI